MNKGIAIKAGIILGFFAVVLTLAFGCSSIKDKNISPEIENREGVYLTVGDVEVTRQDLWEMMRISDGLSYLEQYIEENIFLATEISEVSQAEVDEKIEYYKYGTNDADLIAEIQADAELEEGLLEQFRNSMIILGFDPEDNEDLRAFAQLEIAKENVTREAIINAEAGTSLEITDEEIQNYYEDNTKGDVCALDIRFNSEEEATAIFEQFNLVPNFNLGFGLYTGDEDYDTLGTSDFTLDNTTQMTDEETFAEFVKMYNYMNPNETAIATDITFEDFCADYSETNLFDYDEMTDDRVSNDAYVVYANYIFDTLNFEEGGARYSYTLQTLGNFEVLSFKVSQDEVTEYDDLTQAEVDALVDEIVEASITDTTIASVMETYWEDAEYEIFDPIFKLKNEFNGGEAYDNSGSETLVAKINDTEITATMLFDYMDDSIGTYYTIEIVKALSLLESDFYTEIYGTSHDYLDSDNEAMKEHRDELREMKGIFSSDGYAAYGFSSATYTWEEFLILAFGSETEAQVLRDLFVVGNLQPYLIEDSIAYANAATIIQDQIDEYFSLNVEHLLVYVDMDRDFTPDEFNDYVDGLTGEDLTEYNELRVLVEGLIEDRLGDDIPFEDIVTEFNDSLVGDIDNEWAEAKAYGFYLMTEDLSASGSLSNSNTAGYDEDFVSAVKALYDEYVALVANSANEIEELYDDELVQSNFGLHYIYSTEGTDFEQPTAEYDNTAGDYTTGSGGTTVAPNADQVALYIDIKFAETIGEATDIILPSSVYDAIEAYYGTTYQAYFSASGYSIASVNYILGNNPEYATDGAERLEYLADILEVLYSTNFGEDFIIPE